MYVCEMVGNTVKLCGWFYIKDSILGKEFVCCTSIESNHVYFLKKEQELQGKEDKTPAIVFFK